MGLRGGPPQRLKHRRARTPMALATRCPNCHALFRVVADQLKLRGGLVRCGACHHAFDAIGTLSYIDDAALMDAKRPPVVTHRLVDDAYAGRPATRADLTTAGAADGAGSLAAHSSAVWPAEGQASISAAGHEPAEYTTDVQPPAAAPADAGGSTIGRGADEQRMADGQTANSPDSGAAAATENAVNPESLADTSLDDAGAPAFLNGEEAPRRRSFSILFGGGAVLLSLMALMQLVVLLRADILVRFPEARPVLTQLCKVFGCTVNWPARGDQLAVVGSELQALPGTSAFELTAVVRNRGSYTLALPAVELTLTDTANRTVARKVFAPVDYLAGHADPAKQLQAGLEAGADLTIRIAFEARGLNAAGFVVYPFYL